MAPVPPSSIPSGWYPDPSGAPQWRVWNGHDWSTVTRPFSTRDDQPTTENLAVTSTLSSLRLVRRFGVVALFGGLGLLLSALAHWPGTHSPTSPTWAQITLLTALGLLTFGTVGFAYAVRTLQGYWSFDAFVPGLNVLSLNVLCAQRLGVRRIGPPVGIELALLVFTCATFHQTPLSAVLLAAIARSFMLRIGYVIEHIVDAVGTRP